MPEPTEEYLHEADLVAYKLYTVLQHITTADTALVACIYLLGNLFCAIELEEGTNMEEFQQDWFKSVQQTYQEQVEACKNDAGLQ